MFPYNIDMYGYVFPSHLHAKDFLKTLKLYLPVETKTIPRHEKYKNRSNNWNLNWPKKIKLVKNFLRYVCSYTANKSPFTNVKQLGTEIR